MTQVTMPVSLGASGDSYSDDGSADKDMTNGGHRTNLMPLLEDVVAVANSALASAQSAVNAPGTNGTSVTAMTIGTGAQAFTTQTAKNFVVGQSVKIAITASPTDWMLGDITAYDAGTGAMTVDVTAINGSGTASAWTIGLSAPTVSLNYVPYAAKTDAYTVLKSDMATLFDCAHAAGFTLGYTAAATLGADWWGWAYNSGAGTITLDPAGAETINGALTQPVLPGELWLVLCTGAAFKAFCLARPSLSASAAAPSPTFPYMLWVDASAAPALLKIRNGANSAWITLGDVTEAFLGLVRQIDAQYQTYTAFTTTGTAPNYVITPSPALTALTADKTRLNLTFHAAGTTGSNTGNISGLGALNFKQYAASGAKVAAVIVADMAADVIYDGTDLVILNPLPPAASRPPVRQTVLSGPVDANGLPNFGGATGSTTVTATGTLKAAAAAGDDDYIGSIVNPSWTGLSTNGTMYLYLDITSAGVVTTGSTALAPTYQWGGAYSTTSGQHTYNIQEATMKVGSGAAATQVYRTFVGEVTVAGGVTTAITWYALMGRCISPDTTLPANGTAFSANHNIGTSVWLADPLCFFVVQTAEAGFSAGDVITAGVYIGSLSYNAQLTVASDRLAVSCNLSNSVNVQNKSTGANAYLTSSNLKYRFVCNRGW